MSVNIFNVRFAQKDVEDIVRKILTDNGYTIYTTSDITVEKVLTEMEAISRCLLQKGFEHFPNGTYVWGHISQFLDLRAECLCMYLAEKSKRELFGKETLSWIELINWETTAVIDFINRYFPMEIDSK